MYVCGAYHEPPLYLKTCSQTSNESGASTLPDKYLSAIVRFIQVLQIIRRLIAEQLILIYILMLAWSCCGNIIIYSNTFWFEISNLKLI